MAAKADNSPKAGKRKATPGSFKPGQSGNPGGRPKKTQEQKDALQAIRDLAPNAAEVLKSMLEDMSVPPAQRLRAAELILDRAYGKAEAKVEVSTADGSVMDEVRRRMDGVTP